MTINSFIYENRESFDSLILLVQEKCQAFDECITLPRWYWELGNTIYSIYRNCLAMNISRITPEMIRMFTMEYSKNYFPELMHVSMVEYEQYFQSHYKWAREVIHSIKKPQVRLLDVGCGIAHMGIALYDTLDLYIGYDQDPAILAVNKALIDLMNRPAGKLKLEQENPLDLPCSDEYEIILFYHVFKHMNEPDRNQWIQYIAKYNPDRVVIYDQVQIINKIAMSLSLLGIPFVLMENYLIVNNEEACCTSDGGGHVSFL